MNNINKNIEKRSNPIQSSTGRKIEGYALVFESESDPALGYIETISRSAVTQETINSSDIFALFDHDPNKVLARSKNGEGSLKLSLDNKGLFYSFESPETDLGNTVLEYIRRGEVTNSSFSFRVADIPGASVLQKDENGIWHRRINNIEALFDVSPVFKPAYNETSAEIRKLITDMETKDKENRGCGDAAPAESTDEKDKEMKSCEGSDSEKETREDDEKEEQMEKETDKMEHGEPDGDETMDSNTDSANSDSNTATDSGMSEDEKDKEDKSCGSSDSEKEEKSCVQDDIKEERSVKNTQINIKTKQSYMKKFSLVKAIRSVAENRSLDALTDAVNNEGIKEMRNAGLAANGQIILPVEKRAITVTTEGEDIIETNLEGILEPLRAKNVLAQAGATFLTGLAGNVQFPIMTGQNVAWEGEVDEAAETAATFTHKTLSPKRISAFVDLSKQLLAQDTLGVENIIKADIINALNEKLEATILGSEAGTATIPAGIGNGLTATKVTDFKSICDMEAALEEKNLINPIKYIASPKARAYFRDMQKGTKNNTVLAYNGTDLDGTPVLSTSNVAANEFYLGDWSNLAIAQFGALDLTVDNYTQATKGMVRVVINAYFDAKILRDGIMSKGTFATA